MQIVEDSQSGLSTATVDRNVAAESAAGSKYDPLAGTPPDKGEAA
jgi:hypothetical protein